ncbi:hypothetical protein H4S01_002174 [Coemansia sp. RSA 2610]|nr:hypothetical protein H4S01_002174 [Coemansia sp. RSA 2610]
MATLAVSGATLTPSTTTPPPAAASAVDEGWQEQLASKVIQGLSGRSVSVGRSSVCTVQIGSHATTISRRHADIAHAGGSRYQLRVLGLNGVRVNGQLHAKDAVVELRDSDELNFVGVRYRFRQPAAGDGEAEDWWPEPVAKRALDAAGQALHAQHKRARLLAADSESYYGSADTLVGSSEPGLFGAGDKHALTAQQVLNDLPPSSPPQIHSLSGMFGSESEAELDDELPDAVDIETVTPAQSQAATPLPLPLSALASPTLSAAASNTLSTPLPVTAVKKTAAALPKMSKVAKENVSPAAKAPLPLAKPASLSAKATSAPAKPRKKAGGGDEQRKAPRPPKARPHRSDDEMMASLRELLGIVDPSECLADAIDSETEEFLTTRPEQPIGLASESKLVDVVVETMVFSARTSHTVSDLLRDIARVDGDDAAARAWRHHLTWTLFHSPCFGRVERRVKDASDRRAEDRWYYDAAKDDCAERRENFGGLVRTARRCTLRDTQYFFKQVPKLPSFRYR